MAKDEMNQEVLNQEALDNFNAIFADLEAMRAEHEQARAEMQHAEDFLAAKLEEARGGLAQPLVTIKATGIVADKGEVQNEEQDEDA